MASRLRRLGNLNECPSGSWMVRSAWSKEMHTLGEEKGSEQCPQCESWCSYSHGPKATGPPRALTALPHG